MKKSAAGIGVLVALLVPASSSAFETATDAASAKRATGFVVNIEFQKTAGEPSDITKFNFKRLKMNCDQGKVLLSAKLPDMSVTNDHFEDSFTSGGGTVSASGDFNNKATKVEGTVSASGTFPNSNGGGNFTGCEGSKDYIAK